MKTILKLALVLVATFTTMNSFAGEGEFLLKVKNSEGKHIGFSINGIQKINVAIYEKDRTLIYSEKATGKEGIVRTYNLEEFPDGTYTIELENNLKKVKYEITIGNRVADMSKKPIAVVYKTSFENGVKLANAH